MLMPPSRLLQREIDEIRNIGWKTKTTHFQSHQCVSDDMHDRSEFPRSSCDQPSMDSLTGFSIPRHFLCRCCRRFGQGLGGRHCNRLLRWFQMTLVLHGLVIESPPGETLYGVDFDLGLGPD